MTTKKIEAEIGGLGRGSVRLLESDRDTREWITPHSHRFDFVCLVLAGEVENVLFAEGFGRNLNEYSKALLVPVDGGMGRYDVTRTRFPVVFGELATRYQAGDVYAMSAEQIHSIRFGRGARVLFFEGPKVHDVSVVLEPWSNGKVVETFTADPWMFEQDEPTGDVSSAGDPRSPGDGAASVGIPDAAQGGALSPTKTSSAARRTVRVDMHARALVYLNDEDRKTETGGDAVLAVTRMLEDAWDDGYESRNFLRGGDERSSDAQVHVPAYLKTMSPLSEDDLRSIVQFGSNASQVQIEWMAWQLLDRRPDYAPAPKKAKRCRHHGLTPKKHCAEMEKMLQEVPGDFCEGEADEPHDVIERLRLAYEEACFDRDAAMKDGDDERAAIVAWLRERQFGRGGPQWDWVRPTVAKQLADVFELGGHLLLRTEPTQKRGDGT